MTKIKELFARLKKALGSAPKSGQGKAFVRVVQFFAVMLVLTIFARGASGATMARVQGASTHGAEIMNSIDTTGVISAQGTEDIELPAGLTVSKIVAQQGSTVKEGAPLLEFDMDALATQIEEENIKLRTLELDLRTLQLPGEADKTVENAQKQVDKAQKDYDDANSAVKKANDTANAARDNFNQLHEAYAQLDEEFEREAAKPEEEQDKELLGSLWSAREDAYAVQHEAWLAIDTFEAEHEMAKTTREGFADALTTAQEGLAEARETAARNAQTQAIADDKTKLDIEQKQTEIEKQQELIKTLEAAQAAGGTVVSPVEGVVVQMPFEEGGQTDEKSVVRVTTAEQGYYIECMVDQKDAGEIKLGDNLAVKKANDYYSSDAPVMSKTVANADGMVTIRASLPGSGWETGETLNIQVVTKRQQYGYCVPLSAVHSDGNSSYVYVLRDENTILGEQTIARRVDVSVLAQDSTNVAIDGAVYGELILISSTKPVNEGDRVRIEGSGS